MGRTIRLPIGIRDWLGAIQQAEASLESRFHRRPTLAELSAEVALPEDKVAEAIEYRLNLYRCRRPLLKTARSTSRTLWEILWQSRRSSWPAPAPVVRRDSTGSYTAHSP